MLHSQSVKNTPESVGEGIEVSWYEECSQPPPFYGQLDLPWCLPFIPRRKKEHKYGRVLWNVSQNAMMTVDLQTVD